MARSMDLADIKDVSVFAEHVGSLFQIEVGPNQIVDAELIEAEALNAGTRDGGLQAREPFSLLFAVQGGIELSQQIYRLEHEQLGEIPVFLTPVGGDRMESIFN